MRKSFGATCWIAILMCLGALPAAADSSSPLGTWYLSANNFRLTVSIGNGAQAGTFQGTLTNENGGIEQLDNITWDATARRLEFRRNGNGFWQWYRGTVVEGVLVGRFSHDAQSSAHPGQLTAYTYHVTGWNSSYLDQALAPRVFEVLLNNQYRARLRIDSAPDTASQYLGRLKVYSTVSAGSAGEEVEYDLEITKWDGINLNFTRRDPNWTQFYTGAVSGRTVSGTFSQAGTPGNFPWNGYRAEVLSFGYALSKGPLGRAGWQDRTRHQLYHLMMADNPQPVSRNVVSLNANLAPIASNQLPPERDDNPAQWPQNYRLTELQFNYTLPNVYSGQAISRQSHGYLAVPTTPAPQGGKYPAVVAVNGHGGSAWKMMNPDDSYFWYGDAFARRGFVVLAVDISHRPVSDRVAPYMANPLYGDTPNGDDPAHSNNAHPSIKAAGFDSDWEEDGERAWDVMRALDYLLSLANVDSTRVVVTGLSMGGEITTILGGLEPRFSMSVPTGFSPDVGVMIYHGNHPCWQWLNADVREYVDTSDFYALTAPRPLIVETGKIDFTFSQFPQPFASDKQVLRRSRIAYGGETGNIAHYLHYDQHHYHVGDVNPTHAAEGSVRIPEVIAPTEPWSFAWQTDARTFGQRATLFDFVAFYLHMNK